MSNYKPSNGDRVRVVLEGAVGDVDSTGGFMLGTGLSRNYIDRDDSDHVVSIEKMDDPEPAVGSVVVDKDGDAWQRSGKEWDSAVGLSSREWSALSKWFGPAKVVYTP